MPSETPPITFDQLLSSQVALRTKPHMVVPEANEEAMSEELLALGQLAELGDKAVLEEPIEALEIEHSSAVVRGTTLLLSVARNWARPWPPPLRLELSELPGHT